MTSIEGSIVVAFTLGVLGFICTKIGFTIASKFDERKGYIGTVLICLFAGALLWLNSGSIASNFGASRSEVELIAIAFFIIPILYLLIRNREYVKDTTMTGYRASKKTASVPKKATRKYKERKKP